nr:hypothetical protein [Bradyrhizobium sp. 41S5]
MHLAGAKHCVSGATLAGSAVDVAGLGQVDGDAARDAAERLAPADDISNRLLIHAVLQRHDVTISGEILPDQHGGPGRVVGLHADEGDVDRLFLCQLLRVGDIKRAHRHREFGNVHRVRDAQSVLAHVLDMLGPGIDEGDVLTRLHHMRSGIAADRTRADDRDLPTHVSTLLLIAADASCVRLLRASLEDRAVRPTGPLMKKAGPCHAKIPASHEPARIFAVGNIGAISR